MAEFRIDVENGSDRGSVIPDVSFRYVLNLNQINEAELKLSGTGEITRTLLTIGATIYIYKNGTLVFKGLVDNTEYFVGGTVGFHASGWEVWLAKDNGAYANSPWASTASATIFSAIIAESTYINPGTIDAGFSMDYRLSTSNSLWNALSNLANKTSQDVSVDYTASPVEISVLDHTGSTTSVAVLNEGLEITDLRKSVGYPRGNVINVFGKGDGDNQITGTATDATSVSTYGPIKKTITDRSVSSTAEANRLAAAELALNKDPPQIFDFDLTNPEYTGIALGDIITLNALDQDVVNQEVRIVGIEEGENNGKAYISLQTTNPELKTLIRNKNKTIAKIQKDAQDTDSYMQGATNIWGDTQLGNADATNPLILRLYVPPNITDEIGNTRINDVKLSYTLKNYKTYSGSLSGNTGNALTGAGMTNAQAVTGAGITNVSATTGAGINNVSATSGAGITNAKQGSGDADYDFGPYTDSSWTQNTSWQSVGTSINTASTSYLFHAGWCVVRNSHDTSSTHEGVWMRLYNTTDGTYFPNSNGVQIMRAMYVSQTVPSSAYGLIVVPLHWNDKNYEIQIKKDVGTNISVTVEYGYWGIQGHTHSNSFDDASHTNINTFSDASHTNVNTFNDANHTNVNTFDDANHQNPAGMLSADYALGETGTGATDTSIKIYNSNNDLLWDSGARGLIEETDVDISSYITANDWYRIEIYPDADALVYGTAYVKGGVDS